MVLVRPLPTRRFPLLPTLKALFVLSLVSAELRGSEALCNELMKRLPDHIEHIDTFQAMVRTYGLMALNALFGLIGRAVALVLVRDFVNLWLFSNDLSVRDMMN